MLAVLRVRLDVDGSQGAEAPPLPLLRQGSYQGCHVSVSAFEPVANVLMPAVVERVHHLDII